MRLVYELTTTSAPSLSLLHTHTITLLCFQICVSFYGPPPIRPVARYAQPTTHWPLHHHRSQLWVNPTNQRRPNLLGQNPMVGPHVRLLAWPSRIGQAWVCVIIMRHTMLVVTAAKPPFISIPMKQSSVGKLRFSSRKEAMQTLMCQIWEIRLRCCRAYSLISFDLILIMALALNIIVRFFFLIWSFGFWIEIFRCSKVKIRDEVLDFNLYRDRDLVGIKIDIGLLVVYNFQLC